MKEALIFVSGLALVFLSNVGAVESSHGLSKTFETLGIAMIGYASLRLAGQIYTSFREKRTGKSIGRLFQKAVERVGPPKDELPLFIAVDIEGCITPGNRSEVDLRKFQRLRCYCEFAKKHPEYPPLVIFSGRSQGYVELLAQSLAMLNSPHDLPFVIENGSALYRPTAKTTTPLLTPDQLETIQTARSVLTRALPNNEFEPKSYMVTVNFREGQTLDQLLVEVNDLLRQNGIEESLSVTSTASAVDVTVRGVDKLFGLGKVLERHPGRDHGLERVVAIGDHASDIPIVTAVGSGYCPAENVNQQMRARVEKRFGEDHVIAEPPTDFVCKVIERECGLRLL